MSWLVPLNLFMTGWLWSMQRRLDAAQKRFEAQSVVLEELANINERLAKDNRALRAAFWELQDQNPMGLP